MTQPTSIDEVVEEFQRDFLWINEGNSVMRDDETRVDDWLKIKLTTLVEQARGEGREEAVEEIYENIPLCRERITKCDCRNHDLNDDVFNYLEDLAARTISSDKK